MEWGYEMANGSPSDSGKLYAASMSSKLEHHTYIVGGWWSML